MAHRSMSSPINSPPLSTLIAPGLSEQSCNRFGGIVSSRFYCGVVKARAFIADATLYMPVHPKSPLGAER